MLQVPNYYDVENSQMINTKFRLWPDEVDLVVAHILCDIGSLLTSDRKRDRKSQEGNVRSIVINLLYARQQDINRCVAYYRDKSRLSKTYLDPSINPVGMTSQMPQFVDWMAEVGWVIKTYNGRPDWTGGDDGRVSRMAPTPQLLELSEVMGVGEIVYNPDPIILRQKVYLKKPNKKGGGEGCEPFNDRLGKKRDEPNYVMRLIPYEDTSEIIEMRSQMDRINAYLGRQDIAIDRDLLPETLRERVDLPIRLERKFVDSFARGGRAYGPWIQQVNSAIRGQAKINGELVGELDYDCLHISMCYNFEGLSIPKDKEGSYDLYDLEDETPRKTVKKLVNISLNVKRKLSVINAGLDAGLLGEDGCKMSANGLERVLDAILEKHQPIAGRYLLGGIGMMLQRADSDLMVDILTRLMDQDIVALPIHDSVIVARRHLEAAKQVMIQAYSDRLGFEPGVSQKPFADMRIEEEAA